VLLINQKNIGLQCILTQCFSKHTTKIEPPQSVRNSRSEIPYCKL